MGTRFIAPGVDAERFAQEMNVPVTRGLRGVFLTNTDARKLARNYAPVANKPLAKVVADPTIGAAYSRMQGTADVGGMKAVDTGIKETKDMTFIAIFRPVDRDKWPAGWEGQNSIALPQNQRAMAGGCHGSTVVGAVGYGVAMYMSGTKIASFISGFSDSSGQPASIVRSVDVDPTTFVVVSGRPTEKNGTTIKNHTTNKQSNVPMPEGHVRLTSNRTILIGASHSGGYGGPIELAAFQIHDVALTDAETDQSAQWLTDYVIRKGITPGVTK